MRGVISPTLAIMLAIAAISPLQAMAPLLEDEKAEIAPFNQLVEAQNADFIAGNYDSALELNGQMLELADAMREERPGTKGMILYDRAVILMRKGDTSAALSVLDDAYSDGELQAIAQSYAPVDYYGHAMTTYIRALRDAGRPEWRTVLAAFTDDLFTGKFGQSMWIATWTNLAMIDLKQAGHISDAFRMCNRQIEWFEANPQAAKPRGFAAVGRPTVFVADDVEPHFVTAFALRQGRYESFYAFLRADLEDSCGGISEASGDLDSALTHRRASLDWIRRQDESAYFKVIQLRLARLLAFKGDDNLASQYLDLALNSYRFNANGRDISPEVCSELGFVFDGKPRSAAEVVEKLRSGPLTKKAAEGLNCQG